MLSQCQAVLRDFFLKMVFLVEKEVEAFRQITLFDVIYLPHKRRLDM